MYNEKIRSNVKTVSYSKGAIIANLKLCFEGKEKVHIDEIATMVGHKTAIMATKYADKDGYIKLV